LNKSPSFFFDARPEKKLKKGEGTRSAAAFPKALSPGIAQEKRARKKKDEEKKGKERGGGGGMPALAAPSSLLSLFLVVLREEEEKFEGEEGGGGGKRCGCVCLFWASARRFLWRHGEKRGGDLKRRSEKGEGKKGKEERGIDWSAGYTPFALDPAPFQEGGNQKGEKEGR